MQLKVIDKITQAVGGSNEKIQYTDQFNSKFKEVETCVDECSSVSS